MVRTTDFGSVYRGSSPCAPVFCKICNKEFKNDFSLSVHLKMIHKLSLLKYYVAHQNFIIPKCLFCNDNCKVKKGLSFSKTCGKIKCVNQAHVHAHSAKTKEVLRKKRFKYLKKRTGNTAWEKRNKRKPSTLEQWFIDEVILKFDLNKKYDIISEYAEFPYFIDFAFLNIKLAVELDGPAHFSHGNIRFEHDLNKDRLLLSKGWKVVRIAYNETNAEKITEFLNLLDNLSDYVYAPKILENHLYKNKKLREIRDYNKKLLLQQKQKIRLLLNLLKQLKKIKIVESSSINFSKLGWVTKVAQLLEIKTQKVNKWMKKYMSDFYEEKCCKQSFLKT